VVNNRFEISFTRGRALPLMSVLTVKPRQFIVLLYVVLLVGSGVGAGALFLEARAEYHQLKLVEAKMRQRLATEQARLKTQEEILRRLRSDPEYVEKILRTRWGYARPGEVIFRFPE
jgi:cell division protein DivIC